MLHKPARKIFKTRPVIFYDIDEQWQADLVNMSKLARHNSRYKYLFSVCTVMIRISAQHSSDIRQGQYFENGFHYIYWDGKTIFRTANKTALFCHCKLPGM